MIYRCLALLCFIAFYACYFGKVLIQKRKGIVTDQIGKGSSKNKTYYVEKVLKIVTIIVPVVDFISIMWGKSYLNIMGKVIGLFFAAMGIILFFLATFFMKDNWRAGVAREESDRTLVTNGIYKYSRNPAFLGFDFLYIGLCLMYCNPATIVATAVGIVIFHLQIKEEEKFLGEKFGEEFAAYKQTASRYFGFGKMGFKKVIAIIYAVLFVWSVFYFITLIVYAGPFLSWIWLWILLGAFSALRFFMLYKEFKGTNKIKIPKPVYFIYVCFCALCLTFFAIVEFNIIKAMTATPKDDLSYVILLGAGVNGTTPTRPLVCRLDKATEYMKDNPNTVLIASGGQGMLESISEAECIRRELVKRGIDENRIILEDKSTSTEENLRYSLEIIKDPNADVGLITNSFHEYRAGLIAESEGYTNVTPVPAVTLFPVGIHYIVREFFGVVRLKL